MKEIKRNMYLEKLINRRENGLIKIVTGIRRCGKSYLIMDDRRRNISYRNTRIFIK